MDNNKNNTDDKQKLMTETPIPRLIWKMAIPTIISMWVTGLYSSADTYFVSRVSTEATAAVGLVFSVQAITQALGFFCGHGSGTYMARLLGADDTKKAAEIAVTGFSIAVFLGFVIAIVGNLAAYPIADFIGATDATREYTLDYMRIILMGAPIMMGQFVQNNQLRYQGDAFYAMIGLLCGAIVNVILDPILITVLGMGVRGAAIATICGQCISFVILFIGTWMSGSLRPRISNIHVNKANILEIVNGGAPSLFRQGLAAISILLLNRMAGMYGGEAAIAGMSITTRMLMLLLATLLGFGQGYQPVCAYNYGAGLYDRVREGFFYCVKWGTVMMTIMGVTCFIGAEQVIRFFRDDPAVIAVGTVALKWQTAVLPLLATSIITNMFLQSTGKGLIASITSSARNGIFFVPLILILPFFFGLRGVEMTQAVADVMTFLFCIPIASRELRRLGEEDLQK